MIKSGIGYDAHQLGEGESLIIGGVKIESKLGSIGHSDGDVLIHALCDALLGSSGKGDMGLYFDSSNKYKNMDSSFFLKETMNTLRNENYNIINIDTTVVTEEPRITKHAAEIKKNLSQVMKIEENKINIKSKSNDKLGYVGRHEGIEAYATVLIEKI